MSSKSALESDSRSGLRRVRWRFSSLATRLTVWYSLSSFALILIATGFLYLGLVQSLDREADHTLSDSLYTLGVILRESPADAGRLKVEVEWEWAHAPHGGIFGRVLDARRSVLAETPGMGSIGLRGEIFPSPQDVEPELSRGVDVRMPSGRWFRVFAWKSGEGPRAEDTRIVEIAIDRTQAKELLARYRERLWLVLGLSLLVCGFVSHRIARRGIAPVMAIADTMRRIHLGTLHERIQAKGLPAELAALAMTFDEMLDRLEDAFGRLSRLSSDMAHELRTPVNNLRGEIEVTLSKARPAEEYRHVLESNLEECLRLSRLIDSLLFLARTEDPRMAIQRQRVNVGHELSLVAEFYEAAASERGVRIEVSPEQGVPLAVDRGLLQRALGNLVENALAHTAPGGRIALKALENHLAVRIEVEDDGHGIPAVHQPRIFDRLYRVPGGIAKPNGAGLGLAIVRGVATLHGGSVEVASAVGRGTTISLVFPRLDREPVTA